MSRGIKIVGVIGFVVCVVLSTAAPGGAEPALPPLAAARLVAGNGDPGYSGDGQAATDARLGRRLGLDVAADGTLVIADPDNRRVRRVGADGVIDTVPAPAAERSGGPWFENGFVPYDVVAAPDGSLYLASGDEIGRLGRNGSWTIVGGGGEASFADGGNGGDGGPATKAFLYDAYALDVDAAGRIYVPDGYQQRVRRIDRDGTIRTIAGAGDTVPSAKPIPARSARMFPVDIELDPAGGYWVVSQRQLSTDRAELLHVDVHDMVTKVPLDPPAGSTLPLALAPDGTLYAGYGTFVRTVADDGTTTLAGGTFDSGLAGLAVAADGTLYGAGEGVVERMVAPDPREGRRQPAARAAADPWADEDAGTVHRIAGDGRYRDADALNYQEPRPPEPENLVPAEDGAVYLLDRVNARVLHVAAGGRVDVLATLGGDDPISCIGLARGPDGALYTVDAVANHVLRVTTDGSVSDVDGPKVTDDPVPSSLAVDRAGRFYLLPAEGRGLVRYTADGAVTPFAGGGDRDDERAEGGPARAATMYGPEPAAIAPDGSVAILEQDTHAVRVVRPNGTLVTVAGGVGDRYWRAGFGGDGRAATKALLNNPRGVAFGPDGTLYIADTYNNRVRRVGRDGVITTIAGTGERAENGDGGPAARAALLEPEHLTVAEDGAIWVTGAGTTRLRRIDPDGTISTPADVASTTGHRPETLVTGGTLAVDPHGTVYVSASDRSILAVKPGERAKPFGPGSLINTIAAAPDGSLYLGGLPLWHRYSDGVRTPVLGASAAPGEPSDGADARTVALQVEDSAVGPDGTLVVATTREVYALVGGRLQLRWRMPEVGDGSSDGINGIAVGPDGTLYAATAEDEVVAVRDGKARRVAGNGEDVVSDDDVGDGGPATEAVVAYPYDVALASDGTLYVSTLHGIRRVTPDGDIDTIVPGGERPEGSSTVYTPPTSLAVDAHDNLYFTEPDLDQVRVVVHANQMSDQSGTSLWWWLGGAVLVIAAAVFLWSRRRATSAAEPTSADTSEPAPPKTEPTDSDVGEPVPGTSEVDE